MKTQKSAEVKSQNITKPKTAIIYCRAADIKATKLQQAEAENRAKELNATVEAVFIDIIPAQKRTFFRQILHLFRKNQPQKANKRPEWRKTANYLKDHKTYYAITRSPDRISRNFVELGEIESNIRKLGARLAYYTVEQSDMDKHEALFSQMRESFCAHSATA